MLSREAGDARRLGTAPRRGLPARPIPGLGKPLGTGFGSGARLRRRGWCWFRFSAIPTRSRGACRQRSSRGFPRVFCPSRVFIKLPVPRGRGMRCWGCCSEEHTAGRGLLLTVGTFQTSGPPKCL